MLEVLGSKGSPGNRLAYGASVPVQREIKRVLSRDYVNLSDWNLSGRGMLEWMRTLTVATDVIDSRRMNAKAILIFEGGKQFAFYGRCRLISVLALLSYPDSDPSQPVRLTPDDLIWIVPKGGKGVHVRGPGGNSDAMFRATELKSALDHARTCEEKAHYVGRCASG